MRKVENKERIKLEQLSLLKQSIAFQWRKDQLIRGTKRFLRWIMATVFEIGCTVDDSVSINCLMEMNYSILVYCHENKLVSTLSLIVFVGQGSICCTQCSNVHFKKGKYKSICWKKQMGPTKEKAISSSNAHHFTSCITPKNQYTAEGKKTK